MNKKNQLKFLETFYKHNIKEARLAVPNYIDHEHHYYIELDLIDKLEIKDLVEFCESYMLSFRYTMFGQLVIDDLCSFGIPKEVSEQLAHLKRVHEKLKMLIIEIPNPSKDLLDLEQDITKELNVNKIRPSEQNRLIERAYLLFDKYIV